MSEPVTPCPATVYSRCLWRAARISGDTEALAAYLGVTHAQLIDWMTDVEVPPQQVFHKAVDLVVGVDAVLDVSELAAFLARSKLPITLPGRAPAPKNEGSGPHSQ